RPTLRLQRPEDRERAPVPRSDQGGGDPGDSSRGFCPVSARILDGTAIGKTIRDEVAVEVARLKGSGRRPGLAAVLVGEDPASAVYVRSKGKACEEAGMHSVTVRLPPDTPEVELLANVDRLNADPRIHGILV